MVNGLTPASVVGLATATSDSSAVVVDVLFAQVIVDWTVEVRMTLDDQELIHPDDLKQFWIDLDGAVPGMTLDRKARFRHKDGRWVCIHDVSSGASPSR